MTGLPIDFQIQQQSWANKHFSRKDDPKHQRSALFVVRDNGRGRLKSQGNAAICSEETA
jgi:hypothetical protein